MIHLFGIEITLFQIVATVLGIGILVFIHELGHFMMAKKFGIRVERFSFGFGPEIVGFTRGETRYTINAIPLGGMVKMPGEDIDEAQGSPDEFMSQPWYRRLTIAFFGPFMNYLLAVILFATVYFVWGVNKPSPEPVVGDTLQGMPAAEAGLQAGDRVLSIDGNPVDSWTAMAAYIHARPEQQLDLLVRRDGETVSVTVTPRPEAGQGMVGIIPDVITEDVGLLPSVGLGVRSVVYQTVFTLQYLGQKLLSWEKPEVAGPIGVVQVLAKAAESGYSTLLHLLAVISVALGLFNLLPIPLVDGGHIVLALIEGVIRRPINRRIVQIANFVGFAIIISIFLFATYSDLTRLGLFVQPR